jgi:hypothetical protein
VKAARHLLLAGAGFPGDEHRHVGGRRASHLLVDLEDRRAPAHELLLLHARAEALVLLDQPPLLERAAHHPDDRVHVEGLGQVVEGALLDGVQRPLDVPEGGEDDDRRVRVPLQRRAEHPEPVVRIRHRHVCEDDVHRNRSLEQLLRSRC